MAGNWTTLRRGLIGMLGIGALIGLQSVPALAGPVAGFHPEKLKGICNDVYGKIEDNSNREEWSYAYERKVYEAAGVDFKADTAASAREKIRSLWRNYRADFSCDTGDFDVSRGSVLKYAFNVRTYDFVDNAMKVWGLDLNLVDDSDGKTMLDYVDGKLRESSGTELEPVVQRYRSTLIKYGAKHCRELPDTSKCK